MTLVLYPGEMQRRRDLIALPRDLQNIVILYASSQGDLLLDAIDYYREKDGVMALVYKTSKVHAALWDGCAHIFAGLTSRRIVLGPVEDLSQVVSHLFASVSDYGSFAAELDAVCEHYIRLAEVCVYMG